MKRYFETFYIQNLSEGKLVDGERIRGLFVQNNPRHIREAGSREVETQGRFATSTDAPLDRFSMIRRVRDNTLYELIGDDIQSPSTAVVQIKIYSARVIEGLELEELIMRTTLHDFWSGFTDLEGNPIPAYQTGQAFIEDVKGSPKPAPFPYITYDIKTPNFSQNTAYSADVWDKSPSVGSFKLVDHVLEQVSEKIPEDGLLFDGVWLKRNPATFTSHINDPLQPSIYRGVINLVLQNFRR